MVPGFAQRVEALQFIYFEGKKKFFEGNSEWEIRGRDRERELAV